MNPSGSSLKKEIIDFLRGGNMLIDVNPIVQHIINTGYPPGEEPQPIYCDECGKDITDDDVYEDENHHLLCRDCLLMLHEKRW